jgi:hypothetical protein
MVRLASEREMSKNCQEQAILGKIDFILFFLNRLTEPCPSPNLSPILHSARGNAVKGQFVFSQLVFWFVNFRVLN